MSIFDGIVMSVLLLGVFCLYVRIPCFFKHSMKCRLENGIICLAIRILMSRLKSGKKDAEPLTSPDATKRYLTLKLAEKPYEVFCCLYLDNKHRVIEFKEMFYGTIDNASVYPREIVRRCIEVNAAALIMAHNHPSGDPSPSAADRAITAKIKAALSLIDVRVLDHLIVGDSSQEIVSFAESGII
jgi:DNA repair protein RadC